MPKPGVLVVALGTPAELSERAIRRFLRRFLADRRVVDFHPALWRPILHGFVLPFRPRHIKEQYEHVWLPDGSPLEVHTRTQRDHLSAALPGHDVRYAMTYTEPTIEQTLEAMAGDGIEDLTVVSLYPQFAPSTVAPVIDQVSRYFARRPAMPHLRLVRSWETSDLYISWYAQRLREMLDGSPTGRIVFSYHGVRQRRRHAPEAYHEECTRTTEAIMALVGEAPYEQTYQSVFGPGAWLTPVTIDRMAELPAEGVDDVVLVTPGFFADCIETSFEIDVLNQAALREAGGVGSRRLAPPNSDPDAGEILAEVIVGSRQPNHSR